MGTSALRIPQMEAELEDTCLYVLRSMARSHGYPAETPLVSAEGARLCVVE